MSKTLLLVDDEAAVRRALRRSLMSDGYRILEAECGEGALNLLAANQVDAILTDQRMPAMSGAELLCQARRQYPDTLRIMVSGQCDIDGLAQAVNDADLHRFVHKPWDDQQLRQMLQHSLQLPQADQSAASAAAPLSLVADFNRAICDDEITQRYLPLISTDSGAVSAVEACLQWHNPSLGLASHREVLALGDTCNADKLLHTAYLNACCAQLKHWHLRRFSHLQVMVRLSERMLMDPFTPQLLRRLLADYDLPAAGIMVAFSNADLRPAPYDIWNNLQRLGQMGVPLCLDEFQQDSANITLLESLPVELLRIDRAVLDSEIERQAGKHDYTCAFINSLKSCDVRVIVAGIDQTCAHYQSLISGCDYLQGEIYGEARHSRDLRQVFLCPESVSQHYH